MADFVQDDSFQLIKRKVDSEYNINLPIWSTWWTQANIDTRCEAGCLTLADYNPFGDNVNLASFTFNRTRPLLNLVSGQQRRNRKTCIFVPQENGSQKTADQWTKLCMTDFKNGYAYDAISAAFYQSACVTGMALMHLYLDFVDDPISGTVKFEMLPFNCYCIDPYFRDPFLSDCSYIMRRTYMSNSQAAHLLPEKYDEIMGMAPTGTAKTPDQKFPFMPETYGALKNTKIAYDEFYYRDYRTRKLLQDKISGESMDISRRDALDVERMLATYPQLTVVEQSVPTVNLAILVNNKVMYNGRNPLNIDSYPFVFFYGYYAPSLPYFYDRFSGIARSMRDPQLLYNRRKVLIADLQDSLLNSGYIVDPTVLIDLKQLYQTGNGRVITLKPGANPASIVQLQPPTVPDSAFRIQEGDGKELNTVSGINEELSGMATEDLAGILSRLRSSAGLVSLQPLFDNLDNSQMKMGTLYAEIVRANYTPGKIKAMLNEEPSPYFYNQEFGKYRCTVEAGFDTDTQKQMQFAQLFQLKQIGVPIPDKSLLDAATIQNKDEIIRLMQQQQQQQQQLEQQQAQVNMQESQMRAKLAESRAYAESGQGAERFSRIEENKELAKERKAAAVKDEYLAVLHLAQALKELDAADLSQLEQVLQMRKLVQSQEQREPNKERNELPL